MTIHRALLLLITAVHAGWHPVSAQVDRRLDAIQSIQQHERAAVLAVIDRYFATMAARDSAGMRAILTNEGMFHGKYTDAPEQPARLMPHGPYLHNLGRDTVPLLERYWDPVVYLEGPIATVTTPYDFYVGRKLKHCGIDHFTLVKEADGWKISGGVFTMQRTGCPASPLGPAYE